MNSMVIVLLVALSTAYASVLPLGVGLVGPGNPGALLKGPAAHATVHGPDGSLIVGSADAGALAAAPIPGGHVSAAVAPGVVAAPILAPAPILASAPILAGPIIAKPVIPSGSISVGLGGAVIAGPSGSVSSNNGLGYGLGHGVGLGHGLGFGLGLGHGLGLGLGHGIY